MRVKANLRHELKYLIDLEQMNRVREAIEATMTPDAHGDRQGAYQISSLYYDTPDYKAYWDKVEGHKVRRKVRVRVYGDQVIDPETPAFVEIKARTDKLMAKRRARMPYAQAIDFDAFEQISQKSQRKNGEAESEIRGFGPSARGLLPLSNPATATGSRRHL